MMCGKLGGIKENDGSDRHEHQDLPDHVFDVPFVFCRNAHAGVVKPGRRFQPTY